MENILDINVVNFNEIVSVNEKVIIEFWAQWCSACGLTLTYMDEFSKKYNKLILGRVETDNNDELIAKYKITTVPTFIFFDNGVEKDRVVAVNSYNAIKEFIEKNI